MLEYTIEYNHENQPVKLKTKITGKALLSIGQINKGTAFTQAERIELGLLGKLPQRVETLEEQAERAYQQYHSYNDLLNRNIYLNNLLNTNQTLFYKLLEDHLAEVLPTVYTPIVGSAVQSYNRTFTRPRGIYISYENRQHMLKILKNRTHPDVRLLVVTDGEGVLGIGDQGIGAMDIPVAKLAVYTAFAHINPMHVLPIMLDVGTNNSQLLHDPLYLGWRHERIAGAEYEEFLEEFMQTVKQEFPKALLHWEDLGRHNAQCALDKYRDQVCSFNDDIQGTGIVCLAAILSALNKNNKQLPQQKIVVFGAGTAGMGITHHIHQAMCKLGLSQQEAARQFWLVDRNGLLTEQSAGITAAQHPYLRPSSEINSWGCQNKSNINLFEVIKQVKPDILIGCSAQAHAFSQPLVEEMCRHVEHPVILPLSNPTDKSEANPADLYRWSKGKVLTATGSPFPAYKLGDKTIHFSQCNNYLAFPGLGLGAIAVEARTITDNMLNAASEALGKIKLDTKEQLLPCITQAETASLEIACAVAQAARDEQVAGNTTDPIIELIKQQQWQAKYLEYKLG